MAISNAGPSSATTATLTDLLPADITFDPDASDPRCADAAGTITCALASIDPGTTVTVRIAGTLDPSYDGTDIVNTATFTSAANPTPVTSGPVTTPVEQSADLHAIKIATGDAVAAGTAAEFTITIANQGPSTARDVVFNDVAPPGLTLGTITPTAPLTCSAFPCAVGDLLPGETASVVVTFDVPADAATGQVTNTAIADSPTPDPDLPARTARATIDVIRNADITVTKTLLTAPVVAGQPVTYQLVVSNAGPSAAVDATITDALPVGTSFASGSISGGAPCEQTDVDAVPTVSCVAPSIPVGGTVIGTLTLNTTADIGPILRNTVVAGSQALDAFDDGNTSLAQALVQVPPDTTTSTTTTTDHDRSGDHLDHLDHHTERHHDHDDHHHPTVGAADHRATERRRR